MKKLPAFIFIGCIFFCFFQADGQPSDTYYRYFSLQLKSLEVNEINDIQDLIAQNDMFGLDQHCQEKSKLLIKVDASYPKRVQDIESELETIIKGIVGEEQFKSLNAINADAKSNFCQ